MLPEWMKDAIAAVLVVLVMFLLCEGFVLAVSLLATGHV